MARQAFGVQPNALDGTSAFGWTADSSQAVGVGGGDVGANAEKSMAIADNLNSEQTSTTTEFSPLSVDTTPVPQLQNSVQPIAPYQAVIPPYSAAQSGGAATLGSGSSSLLDFFFTPAYAEGSASAGAQSSSGTGGSSSAGTSSWSPFDFLSNPLGALNAFTGGSAASAGAVDPNTALLQAVQSGADTDPGDIRRAQQVLVDDGYLGAKGVDGINGPKTNAAATQWLADPYEDDSSGGTNLDDPIKKIGDIIASGEGNYESYNSGTKGVPGHVVGYASINSPAGTVNSPEFSRHLGAIINGNDGGVCERKEIYG